MKNKADYGIDAPGVIRNLITAGAVIIIIGAVFPWVSIMGINIKVFYGGLAYGSALISAGLLMLLYSVSGKFFHRDRMLNMVNWKGSENVLDVGTGRGLLLIGAAKRLNNGKATGIDIWNKKDLTSNLLQNTLKNASDEGVSEKIEVLNEDVRKMSFPDGRFDVILSNLCLHNIQEKEERIQACREIYRVLKPGGTIILSDYKNTGEYEKELQNLRMKTETSGPYVTDTFPPLKIIKAVKISE